LQIPTTVIKELRERLGAGIMECRQALIEAECDLDKAAELLLERGLAKAARKADRATPQGLIEAYIHPGARIGVLLEINCETDFVARTEEFKALAHDIVMQIAALSPGCLSPEDIPPDSEEDPKDVCLLRQPFIKDPAKTVEEVIKEVVAKVGENIRVRRFVRFELGG